METKGEELDQYRSNLERLRTMAAKHTRQSLETEEEFVLASGAAFSAALFAKTAVAILPEDMRDYMTGASTIAQTSGTTGNLSIHHTMSRLLLFAADVPGGQTGMEGGMNYSWMRRVTSSTGLGCHQASPPVTSTFNGTLQKLVAPLDATSGNYGALVSNPAYSDFGGVAYLADIVISSTSSWNDDTPVVRMLLLADLALDIRTLRCDPLFGQIAMDGRITKIRRTTPTNRPDKCLNPDVIECIAVTLDTWVGMRTGMYNYPNWGLGQWSHEIAIVPVTTSMLNSSAMWLYIASFVTSRIWNFRHIWTVTMAPYIRMSSAQPDREFDFYVRPRAASVLVEGPERVMLVVTNATQRSMTQTLNIQDRAIPVWSPDHKITPTNILPDIEVHLDLRGPTQNVSLNWLQAWRWMCEHIISGDSLNRSLMLVAEATRVTNIGPLYNDLAKTEPLFWSIRLNKDPPVVGGLTWNRCNWDDIDPSEEEEKKRLNVWIERAMAAWISPYCIHSSMYGIHSSWTNPDWLDVMIYSDQSLTCHEATPDMRLARFIGLIAPGTPITYIDPIAVQENISGAAALAAAATSWMQEAAGISWLRWAAYNTLYTSPMAIALLDKLMNEATTGHITMVQPGDWWTAEIAKVIAGRFSFEELLRYSSTSIQPWWMTQYVVQKVNYVIPGDMPSRQRDVQDLTTSRHTVRIGWHAESNAYWQALARYTSMLGIRMSNDAVYYAVNHEHSAQLVSGFMQVSWNRVFGMTAESMYNSGYFEINLTTILDTVSCVFPSANTMCMFIQAEVLVTATKAAPGNTIGEQTISGRWPDPWWDWLLAGVRAAIPLMGVSLPAAAFRGAAAGLHAFLSEKLTPQQAEVQQRQRREELSKLLDTASTAAAEVWKTGKEAVGQVREAVGQFTSGQQGGD